MALARSFTQTLQDVTVSVSLSTPARAKQLSVDLKAKHIAVSNSAINETIIDGELHALVNTEESTWWLEDGKNLFITLEKRNQQEWWPSVLTSDEKIDVTKQQPEQSKLSDLDDGTRATVEKMLFDQQQRERGLPTSDQMQKQKTLENFKKMHPELDFSQIKEPSFN